MCVDHERHPPHVRDDEPYQAGWVEGVRLDPVKRTLRACSVPGQGDVLGEPAAPVAAGAHDGDVRRAARPIDNETARVGSIGRWPHPGDQEEARLPAVSPPRLLDRAHYP